MDTEKTMEGNYCQRASFMGNRNKNNNRISKKKSNQIWEINMKNGILENIKHTGYIVGKMFREIIRENFSKSMPKEGSGADRKRTRIT